jgi:surface protein
MSSLFKQSYFETGFNGDISAWDVSSVINMYGMFRASYAFNNDISDWDVSSVTNMSLMFEEAVVFNSDLSKWNVSSVTDMSYMFTVASDFNNDISSWDVTSVMDMGFMLDHSGLSTENYDLLLVGWSELELQNGVTLGTTGLEFSAAGKEATNILINEFGWTIKGDNGDEDPPVNIENQQTPLSFTLQPNFPNPFNPSTTISYQISEPVMVRLELFTMLGQRVAVLVNRDMRSGNHSVDFDASELASGKYLYRLTAGDFVQTRQMTLIK